MYAGQGNSVDMKSTPNYSTSPAKKLKTLGSIGGWAAHWDPSCGISFSMRVGRNNKSDFESLEFHCFPIVRSKFSSCHK